jgi:sensor histidine kinase YesM
MRKQLFTFILLFFISLMAMKVAVAVTENQHQKTLNNNLKNNIFYDIKIRQIDRNESSASLKCHKKSINDSQWRSIAFNELPQDQHFCLRAAINIDQNTLTTKPILLVGMLASVQFFWDEKLLIKNGEVGQSKLDEYPGVITTLVHIPNNGLKAGKHLLSAEVSTFNIGKNLKTIGYVLGIYDENKLSSVVLSISMVSALFLGILLILSIIFQLIYWLYQKKLSYQLFSLFCFVSVILLAAEQVKFWLDYTYNWHAIRLQSIFILTFLVSYLLPIFYIYQYHLSSKKIWHLAILFTLLGLGFVEQDYDTTSRLLFSSSLIWALNINLYHLKQSQTNKVNTLVLFFGLIFVIVIPEYYSEAGFGLVFICIVMMMLITLIKEMRIHKDQSLQAVRVRTELLRRNMQPHFLMNCLTQLMELIETKPTDAAILISALSDEFRQLTNQSDKGVVPLKDEINLCNKHLKIMSLRYQQEYKLTVKGDTENISVPSSILHSQIENCFTHNHISTDRAFELTIKKIKERIHLILKTPIEKNVNHQGTGTGERYIKAKLAEVSQSNSTFESYQEHQYWLSKFTYPNIEQG